ncbi:MAG: hypothetical protein ABMA00_16115 [Gemmatimonas sp.]
MSAAEAVTVQELRESPRSPGRYALVLSTGQKCVVGVDALADAGATRIGVTLDAAQLARLLLASTITGLVDRALNSLARGRRTRKELELRLRRVEPDARLVAAALDRLEASGVLSDVEAARAAC